MNNNNCLHLLYLILLFCELFTQNWTLFFLHDKIKKWNTIIIHLQFIRINVFDIFRKTSKLFLWDPFMKKDHIIHFTSVWIIIIIFKYITQSAQLHAVIQSRWKKHDGARHLFLIIIFIIYLNKTKGKIWLFVPTQKQST